MRCRRFWLEPRSLRALRDRTPVIVHLGKVKTGEALGPGSRGEAADDRTATRPRSSMATGACPSRLDPSPAGPRLFCDLVGCGCPSHSFLPVLWALALSLRVPLSVCRALSTRLPSGWDGASSPQGSLHRRQSQGASPCEEGEA